MTPDSPTSATPNSQIAQSLFQFWMMPMRVAQSMLEMTSHLIETGSESAKAAAREAAARAEKTVERTEEASQHIMQDAEERIAKLDETRGDTIVNPAALVS